MNTTGPVPSDHSAARVVVRVVDVYPYRRLPGGAVAFLLLRRAPGHVYAGQWRMVGGKIAPGETAWQAAARELREETACTPRRLWTLPSANVFYEWREDRVNVIPAFAAELDADPVLDDEHDAWAWLECDAAVARLCWPEQRRLIRLTASLLRDPLPGEWLVG